MTCRFRFQPTSGKEATLLSPPPLRTGRASFPASGSSPSQRPLRRTRCNNGGFGLVGLRVQLVVTGWMQQGQIGERFITAVCYLHFVGSFGVAVTVTPAKDALTAIIEDTDNREIWLGRIADEESANVRFMPLGAALAPLLKVFGRRLESWLSEIARRNTEVTKTAASRGGFCYSAIIGDYELGAASAVERVLTAKITGAD